MQVRLLKKGACFECGNIEHYRDTCPKLNRQKGGNNNNNNATNKDWKYIAPLDETTTLKRDNKEWKFCSHCKCRHTGKIGLYNLSHTSSEHRFKQVASDEITVLETPAGNNASIGMETNESDGNTTNGTKSKNNNNEENENDLQFEGAWMAEVSNDDTMNVVTVTVTLVKPQLPMLPSFMMNALTIWNYLLHMTRIVFVN